MGKNCMTIYQNFCGNVVSWYKFHILGIKEPFPLIGNDHIYIGLENRTCTTPNTHHDLVAPSSKN